MAVQRVGTQYQGALPRELMFAGKPFSVGRLPRIVFGAGVFHEIPPIARHHGQCVLIVTGNRSLRATRNWPVLLDGLRVAGMHWEDLTVEGEPSPQLVDDAVALFRPKHIDVVIGIGGGSALDAAKAIAGLLQPWEFGAGSPRRDRPRYSL